MAVMPTLDRFRSTMLAAGYDEVLECPWAPALPRDVRFRAHERGQCIV